MRTVALDLGKRKTTFCEVSDGEVIARTTVGRVHHLESRLGAHKDAAVVAIEACRDAWFVHDLLVSWGNEVVMVDTTRARRLGIGEHGKKTDRIDAEVLAKALHRGSIPAAHVLSEHRRKLRHVLCIRRILLSTRSQYITQIRAVLQAHGVTLRSCSANDFAARLDDTELSEQLSTLVKPLRTLLAPLQVQLAQVEEHLHQLCEGQEVVQRLATIPGVAIVVAASFVSVIDDARRFRRAAHVASYLGLVPVERSSGGKRRLGSISKQGNAHLRAALVQSAWVIMRSNADDPLTLWAKAVAERRGKRIAVVAVARRLARVMWAIWKDGTFYEPEHLAKGSAKGLRKQAHDIEGRARKLLAAQRKLDKQRRASARRAQRALGAMEVVP